MYRIQVQAMGKSGNKKTVVSGHNTDKTDVSTAGKKRPNSSEGDSRDSKRNNDKDSTGDSMSVSESIRGANNVLYHKDDMNSSQMDSSVFEAPTSEDTGPSHIGESASCATSNVVVLGTNSSPSNTDIMNFLVSINSKICNMDKRLSTLDSLEQKVSNFDNEKLWLFVQDNAKSNSNAVNKANDRVDNVELALGQAKSQIDQLQQQNEKLQDNLNYLTSQSMRNNLVFSNVFEQQHERPVQTENILRGFLVSEMKLAQDLVDSLKFERVHRMGEPNKHGKRNIVAKFTFYKDRETVRRASTALKGTPFYVSEQFPKDIVERRQALVPQLKRAIRSGKQAWISYDTLYIDGQPVRATNQLDGGDRKSAEADRKTDEGGSQ